MPPSALQLCAEEGCQNQVASRGALRCSECATKRNNARKKAHDEKRRKEDPEGVRKQVRAALKKMRATAKEHGYCEYCFQKKPKYPHKRRRLIERMMAGEDL